MAGYIVKITIEDTHPPVWRRVLVPERITFSDLHEIIQIVFGWEDAHLHEFSIPSKYIVIDNDRSFGGKYHYAEEETLIEAFLLRNKWIRYTYDFGDEWRHKIVYEKTEEIYDGRNAVLLKYRGDNFPEDSGGVWEYADEEWGREVFDVDLVKQRLEKRVFSAHEELEEKGETDISEEIENMLDGFIETLRKSIKAAAKRPQKGNAPSRMARKIDAWKQFGEDRNLENGQNTENNTSWKQLTLPFVQEEEAETVAGDVLEIVPAEKTNAELLNDLGQQEAEDYCKYLQISVNASSSKKQMTEAVARTFQEHPEFLLYVFWKEEYQELQKWLKLPCGIVGQMPQNQNMLMKAMGLGLADISVKKTKGGTRAQLSFAADCRELLEPLSAGRIKQTYRDLEDFAGKLQKFILFYGLIEMDSLYEMFRNVYHKSMGREDFLRHVYWFARFNALVQTAYTEEGTCYVASCQIALEPVLEDMRKYADGLEYASYSASELKKMTEDVSERSEWIDILFSVLHFEMGFSQDEAVCILEEQFFAIMNGETLPDVLSIVYERKHDAQNLTGLCELWVCVSSLMLELQLPMLKGHSRSEYSEEKGISPWETGMLTQDQVCQASKKQHMCDFPQDIQEAMLKACSYASGEARELLWQYKKKEKVQSEEFLCLLAEAYITACEAAKAEKLLKELEKSSARGKQAADLLRVRLQDGMDVMDEEEELWEMPWYEKWEDEELLQMPYVRETPKIGRNDPCPCGSGKKYKKCCGK